MRERGNILFLILLAIILFVALNYAVSSGMRGGGNDASPEKLSAQASALIQYAGLIEQAVTRLRLTNNCKDTQINFEYPIGTNNNPLAPTDRSCNVFDMAGGGVPWQSFGYAYFSDPYFTARNQVKNIGTDCPTSPAAAAVPCLDLLFLLRDVPENMCAAINQQLKITTSSETVPVQADITNAPYFVGTYSSGARILGSDATAAPVVGKNSGCFQETGQSGFSSATPYTFYHVVIPR